jgi:RNA polymerase-binding transcription factor DksA
MTKSDMETYRQQLLELGNRFKGDVGDLSSEAFRKTGGEASGSLSNAPIHMADLGSDNFEAEVTMSLLENEERSLEEIAVALKRIDLGTFGKCEECGKDIARERLRAIPYARLCIDCANRAGSQVPPPKI